MSEADRWIELTRDCNYLPENDLKVCPFFLRNLSEMFGILGLLVCSYNISRGIDVIAIVEKWYCD